MGVADWFTEFCSNLRMQNTGTISARYKAITRRLNTDFWTTTSDTAHSWYVGSYGRNTGIAGLSDLDVLFELPASLRSRYNSYLFNGQSALLQAVRNSIKTAYPNTKVGADGQVVQVPFADGIMFEVLPAFKNADGSYAFPDSNKGGSWRTTNPFPEINALKARNASCSKNLIRLCRMMRAWKTQWDVPISGMLIDTLAYQFMGTYAYRAKSYLYYDLICRDFFQYMGNQSATQTVWRAPGSAQYVYSKGHFQFKAKRCYTLSAEATTLEMKKKEWSAKRKWRDVFGTAFPN